MGRTPGGVESGLGDASQTRPRERSDGPVREQAKGAQPALFKRGRPGPRREAARRDVNNVGTEDLLVIRSCKLQATFDMPQRKRILTTQGSWCHGQAELQQPALM